MKTPTKPPLFRRLLQKMRQHRRSLRSKNIEIERLKSDIRLLQQKADGYRRRLEAVVKSTAERQHFPADIITLCVEVDRKTARDFPSVWTEAEYQLRTAIAAEMKR